MALGGFDRITEHVCSDLAENGLRPDLGYRCDLNVCEQERTGYAQSVLGILWERISFFRV